MIKKILRVEIVLYFVVSFCLIFVGNIIMHIVPYEQQGYADLMINRVSGYGVEKNYFTATNEDPQLYLITGKEDSMIQGIHVDFVKPLEKDMLMEVYYPDLLGQYSEERTRKCQLSKGQKSVDVTIERGQYSEVRIDINGNFELGAVCYDSTSNRIAYSEVKIRYVVWLIDFMLAAIVCFILLHVKRIKNMIERFNSRCCSFVVNKILSKSARIFGIGIFCSIIGGIVIEAFFLVFSHRSYNPKEVAIISLLLFVFYSFVFLKVFYKEKIEFMVAVLILLSGISFSAVMPVSLGVCWDDETHYINTVKAARAINGTITAADMKLKELHVETIFHQEEYSSEYQEKRIKAYNELYEEGGYEKVEGTPFSINTIGYLPEILGIWFSYGLCLSFSQSIIFIRIINVLFVAVMIYLSMKNVKSGKMLIAVFAFVPTVFFLASSFSYDTWLTVMLIYGFSRYFRELQHRDEPLTWGRFLGIFIPLLLALGPKIIYAPLLFLTAYMPKSKFKEKKWRYAYRACFICTAVIMVAVVCYVVSGRYDLGIGDLRGGETVNAMQQLLYIKANLGEFYSTLRTFLKGYFSYENSVTYLTFMAYMGLVNLQWIPLLLLFFTALSDRLKEDAKTIPLFNKLFAILMYVMTGAICAVAMYISFTPVGSTQIAGCQGRYILPAVFPVLYMISRFGGGMLLLQKVKAEYYNMILIGTSVTFLMYNLWVNCAVKY